MLAMTFEFVHAETNQEIITEAAQIDYMFHRMFALINFVLTENDQYGENNGT